VHFTNGDAIVYALANFAVAIFSGVAGGGGGFIVTPLLIALGLSPAQAVASGKLCGLGVAVGSLSGIKGGHEVSRKQIALIMAIAVGAGIISPFFITRLDEQAFRTIMGVLILLMVPLVLYKKVGLERAHPTPAKKAAGYGLVALALAMQGIFSSGMGTLVNIFLMGLVGMPAIDASVAKRYSQLVLNIVIIAGVAVTGLLVWKAVWVGLVTGLAGGYIGGKLAIKGGNAFITYILATIMIASGLWLVFAH
jgi:uncharacterized membrane protein YfcA